MKLAVPTETRIGEQRVAIVPEVAGRLSGSGVDIFVQAGAGSKAHFPDAAYREKGANIVEGADDLLAGADVVAKVHAPAPTEAQHLPTGITVVSFLQPAAQLDILRALVERQATAFSLDLLPRISRAQSMDALSSQATVSGYLAVLAAAERLPKFFPMFMTAAGTVPPAKVLVLGTGVAGLQAIATARRLGAQVRAYDVRSAAKEEVASLGAAFVELELESQEGAGGYARAQSEEFLVRQRELIGNEVAACDVVITTAAVPGRKAPVLVTAQMVDQMAEGSVVVDLAADSGGNCELSQPGAEVLRGGVMVYGMTNPAAAMPTHSSFLYSRNMANFLGLIVVDGELRPDFDDEIVSGSCVLRNGTPIHELARELLEEKPQKADAS
ncbi:MAG: Re/Si-specific NAD(P)(+) transhydrogenase subunit alpha [Acidimicrobiales bacterium]